MTLIPDWKLVLKHAWSVKFNVVAALATGAEVAVQIYRPENIPSGVFAAAAGVISIFAALARLMAQKEISDAASPK